MTKGPSLPQTFYDGIAHHQKGEFAQAKDKYDQALEQAPQTADIHNALGVLGFQTKNYAMAETYFKNCVKIRPLNKADRDNLLSVSRQLNKLKNAASFFEELLQTYPNDAPLQQQCHQLKLEISSIAPNFNDLKRTYEQDTSSIENGTDLAFAYIDENKIEHAEQVFLSLIKNNPKTISLKGNYGYLLQKIGRFSEAEQQYKDALIIDPNNVMLLYNLSNSLRAEQKFDAALEVNDKVLALDPNHAETHAHTGFCHLVQGNLKKGWDEYEWRWKSPSFSKTIPNYTMWDGSDPKDKHILIFNEQGLGDTLQFIRYANHLKKLGARVSVSAQKPLQSLLRTMETFDQIVSTPKNATNIDYFVPTMTLPNLLNIHQIDQVSLPEPYLHPKKTIDPTLENQLNQTSKKKIGVCWRGNPEHKNDNFRSIPFKLFSTLFDISEITFVSLQVERNDKERLPEHVIDAAPYINDFEDTAAIAEKLDLVLTVDTSIVHMCGACHITTWLLISSVNDWRWFLDREDSPWYPTVKIKRINTPNNWEPLISNLRKELVTFL